MHSCYAAAGLALLLISAAIKHAQDLTNSHHDGNYCYCCWQQLPIIYCFWRCRGASLLVGSMSCEQWCPYTGGNGDERRARTDSGDAGGRTGDGGTSRATTAGP